MSVVLYDYKCCTLSGSLLGFPAITSEWAEHMAFMTLQFSLQLPPDAHTHTHILTVCRPSGLAEVRLCECAFACMHACVRPSALCCFIIGVRGEGRREQSER